MECIKIQKEDDMIKVGIIGATGYAGNELVRLLLQHPEAEIVWYGSRSYIDQDYAEVYPNVFQLVDAKCLDDNMEELAKQVDVIFTATPQGFCAEAVYGLCEINREKVKGARLIANPGCYPTCSILSIYPLLKEGLIDPNTIIIDAKSGTSGAGRGAKVANLYCEVNENIKAYGVTTHRHTPEIEEQLGYAAGEPLMVNFTPHLVPMNRGILITAYASLKKDVTEEEVRAIYEKYYDDEYFVRVLPGNMAPETRFVEGSNYVDVNFRIDPRTKRIVMMGAMDNLVKGAAGQAIQNMNLLFGLPENTGLKLVPMVP